MENVTHSRTPNMVSKKTYNVTNSTKSIYDDVFGGPPVSKVPTLSPRVEDYSEIFGGFHVSRASSIPVLDLPLVNDDLGHSFFDVGSSSFDYNEVFGSFNGDFAVSFDELMMMVNGQSNGRDSSSGYDDDEDEDTWIAAEADNLSDEWDNNSVNNHCLSNGDSLESVDHNVEFHVSYNKASGNLKEDMPNGTIEMPENHDVSEYSYMVDKMNSSANEEYEYWYVQENNDGINYGGEILKQRHLKKVMSHPVSGNTDGLLFGTDIKNHREFVRNSSLPSGDFVTISDFNLKTQPSHLPPPSRPPPPPALEDHKGYSGRTTPTCNSIASEANTEDGSPYFDVDLDASSSAAISAVAMKHAVEEAQAKLKPAKQSMEGKMKGLQKKEKEHKVSKVVYGSRNNERGKAIYQREENGMEFCITEEKQNMLSSTEGKACANVAKIFSKESHGSGSLSSEGSRLSDEINGASEWKEATQFFELVTNNSQKSFGLEKSESTFVSDSNFHEHGKKVKSVGAEDYEKTSHMSVEASGWDKIRGRPEMVTKHKGGKKLQGAAETRRPGQNEKKFEIDRQPADLKHENSLRVHQKESSFGVRQAIEHREEESWLKVEEKSSRDVRNFNCEMKEIEKRHREVSQTEKYEKNLTISLEQVDDRRLRKEIDRGTEEKAKKEKEKLQIEAYERKEKEKRIIEMLLREENERIIKEALEQEENARRVKKALENQENERRLKETHEREERLRKEREAIKHEENKKRLKEAREREENQRRLREAREREEQEKKLKEALKMEEERILKQTLEKEERRLREIVEQESSKSKRDVEKNEIKRKVALEEVEQRKQKEVVEHEEKMKRERPQNKKKQKEACEKDLGGRKIKEIHEMSDIGRRLKLAVKWDEYERTQTEGHESEESEKKQKEDNEKCENEIRLEASEKEQIKQRTGEVCEDKVGTSLACNQQEDCLLSRGAEVDHNSEEINQGSQTECKGEEVRELNVDVGEGAKQKKLNKIGEDHSEWNQACNHQATQLQDKHESSEKLEAAEVIYEETSKRFSELGNCGNEAAGPAQVSLENERSQSITVDVSATEKKTQEKADGSFLGSSDVGNQRKKFAYERSERGKNIEQTQVPLYQDNKKENLTSARVVRESIETVQKNEAAKPVILEVKASIPRKAPQVNTSESEKKMKNSNGAPPSDEKEAQRLKAERELEEERLRKIEEREREREREKDRMAVDRRTLETRERAGNEAQQRALNEARERLEKACAEAREKALPDKSSADARLRAERAAVERATAEARQRAFEKAMAERVTFETRERMERSVSDKFSTSSRDGGMKPSPYQYSSVYSERFEGVEGESAQRCKARLERHRRTAERVAKALAEKNMRDLLAQREQAEKNRLAETLDAEVRRWSSGKEGNLRALLSTLQYILGTENGWQPIPLTEVITSAAVKKAYRKATLCVHPDKLQQRGASIQQKYICEKVFDLLKEAWNKFNSEER